MHKWLWLSAVIVVLDQWSKAVAAGQLILHQPVAVLPQLNFMLVYNAGASFGFLSSAGGWQRWFLITLALAVSGYLYMWLKKLTAEAVIMAAGIALIIGGAIGNVIDRVVYGYVIDFIDIYYGAYHWPVFNLADSVITLGAVMIVMTALFDSRVTS